MIWTIAGGILLGGIALALLRGAVELAMWFDTERNESGCTASLSLFLILVFVLVVVWKVFGIT